MPDIDPAALSRSSVGVSTPILSSKTLSISAPGGLKPVKTSQIIPARIDLEPLYSALKIAIGAEQWVVYKESTKEFFTGRLNQKEYSDRLESILGGPGSEKDHLHNQLIAAIYGNVTREMPDQGPAPWVSANDKPLTAVGSKPVTGDAAERRLKGDVMQLPARDRRRIKDLALNDYDPHESLSNVFAEPLRKASAISDVPASASTGGGINKMNFDLEIRKRFTQPLAVESGEFPDVGLISGRMLPFCYEAGLVSGHTTEAPQLMSLATETFIKDVLTSIYSRTRSNGPGDSGAAGFGIGTSWIQTHKYQKQLRIEEELAQHKKLGRDKNSMLPIEAKAASERGVLGMTDLRIALGMADTGLAQFPVLTTQILYGYHEGELENWDNYTWVHGRQPTGHVEEMSVDELNGGEVQELPNGHSDAMDIDGEPWWDGAESQDMDMLDGVLDSCLAVGS